VNFLDAIWLIPLFPALGAALMLVFGRRLDPQPGAGGQGPGAGHGAPSKVIVSLLCPGIVLLSFLLSCGAV
jgi:hypothetical protein